MHRLRTGSGTQRVLVTQPACSTPGAAAMDLAAAYNEAAAVQASVYVVPTGIEACDVLRALQPRDVRIIEDGSAASASLRARWRLAAVAHRAGEWRSRAATSVRVEAHRELRRQAGNERLPSDIRGWLRERGRRLLQAMPPDGQARTRLPRRLLRADAGLSMPPEQVAAMSARASGFGIGRRPVVAMEIGRRPDAFLAAAQWLTENGYDVVRVAGGDDPLPASTVIDETSRPEWTPLLELYVISTCRFVVCESRDLQQIACLTSTPALRVNARDPLSAYPLRANGLFTLAQPVNADTGEPLALAGVLTRSFLDNTRSYVYRDNTGAEAVASVREVHEAIEGGWTDSESQSRFRSRVEALGDSPAADGRLLAEWGPDQGFIGDGRLVRWQADQVA